STTFARPSTSRSTSSCCTPCSRPDTGSRTSRSRPSDGDAHAMTQGLPRRIKLAFIVQAILGSIVITAGVVLAGLLVREGVLSQRMQREADVFWTGRAASPAYP